MQHWKIYNTRLSQISSPSCVLITVIAITGAYCLELASEQQPTDCGIGQENHKNSRCNLENDEQHLLDSVKARTKAEDSSLGSSTPTELSFIDHQVLHEDIRRHLQETRGAPLTRANEKARGGGQVAWPNNYTGQPSAESSMPTVIFEHEGPTITTVDFGNGPQLAPISDDDDGNDDDDEDAGGQTTAFYGSSEVEEGGSNLAQKLLKQPNLRQTATIGSSERVAPSTEAFFQQLSPDDTTNGGEPGDSRSLAKLSNSKVDSTIKHLPDSIRAIKERGGNVRLSHKEEEVGQQPRRSARVSSERAKSAQYDYEDVLATAENGDGKQRIKQVRAELERRLSGRGVASRRRGKSKRRVNSSALLDSPSVSIPLHALLLAALEARQERPKHESDDALPDGYRRRWHKSPELRLDDLVEINLGARRVTKSDKRDTTEPDVERNKVNSSRELYYDDSPTAESKKQNSIGDYEVAVAISSSKQNESRQSAPENRKKKKRGADSLDSGDFDVDQQVNEYADGKNDRSLEPHWMSPKLEGSRFDSARSDPEPEGPSESGSKFDRDFEEMDADTRQKLVKGRRAAISRNQPKDPEKRFEASSDKFLQSMQDEATSDVNDVDETIRNMEQSMPEQDSTVRKKKVARPVGDDDGENDY